MKYELVLFYPTYPVGRLHRRYPDRLVMLALSGWLSALYGLPATFVVGHACVHLVYGTYSFSLAVRKRRPIWMLVVLIFANATWAALCLVFAVTLIGNASVFAVLHFVLEGIYVGCLAFTEWKQREELEIAK